MTAPTLTTARLTLRAGTPADAGPLGRFMESPRAAGIGGPYPANAAVEWIASDLANWATRGSGMWIVTLINDDNLASIRVAQSLGASDESPRPLPDSDKIQRWRHPA